MKLLLPSHVGIVDQQKEQLSLSFLLKSAGIVGLVAPSASVALAKTVSETFGIVDLWESMCSSSMNPVTTADSWTSFLLLHDVAVVVAAVVVAVAIHSKPTEISALQEFEQHFSPKQIVDLQVLPFAVVFLLL